MQIIGDRHYKTDAGETVTFSKGATAQVGALSASVDSGPATALPVSVTGFAHHAVAVAVGFTGEDGGSAQILVRGSNGGRDTSRIRQLTSLPFRTALFVVD